MIATTHVVTTQTIYMKEHKLITYVILEKGDRRLTSQSHGTHRMNYQNHNHS